MIPAEITYSAIVKGGVERPRSDTASVVERSDGSLLVTYHSYSGGPEAGNDFGLARIYTQVSSDGGRSWGEETLRADIEPGDLNVMSPFLCRIPGELLLGYLRMHSVTSSSMMLCRSGDEGETFSEPQPIWSGAGFRVCRLQGGASSLVRLSSGSLLLPFCWMAEGALYRWTQTERAAAYLSDDNGLTWRESQGEVFLPLVGASEPSVAELATGELVMSLRTQLGSVFLSRSKDAGETWSMAQTTGLRAPESCTCIRHIPGSNRTVLFWNNSEYNPRHHHLGVRSPLSVAVSDDGGHRWQYLFDIEDKTDYEYTNLDCTFLRNGEAIVTYMSSQERPDGGFGRECIALKAAIIPRALLHN